MKDKSFFRRMRILIAAGSIAGFVGGWALFAQNNQAALADPTAVVQVNSATTPTANSSGTSSSATAEPTATVTTPQQQTTTRQTTSQTRLRTGGS